MAVTETLNREWAMVLLMDMQTRLLPHIHKHDQVVAAAGALLETAEIADVPVMATVQYVKGLGSTHERLAELCARRGVEFLEKMTFSACRDRVCSQLRGQVDRRQVVIAGVEAHVCVEQTVLDLLSMGRQPFVCADAVSSRRALDAEVALRRMSQAGAIITTTEAVMFGFCELAGTPQFKEILAAIKRFDKAREAASRSEVGVS